MDCERVCASGLNAQAQGYSSCDIVKDAHFHEHRQARSVGPPHAAMNTAAAIATAMAVAAAAAARTAAAAAATAMAVAAVIFATACSISSTTSSISNKGVH